MRKPRKHYAAVEKFAIVRRHLLERVPVSDLCDQYQATCNITTRYGYTARLAMSLLPTSYPVVTRRSLPSVIANLTLPRLAKSQFVPSKVTLAERFKTVVNVTKWIYDGQWLGRRIGLRGDTT